MATETVSDHYFLSSLDPGVGKTQALVHFLRALTSSSEHEGVGAIVFLSKIDEIKELVDALGLGRDQFAILTHDSKVNALGRDEVEEAQVLITTQQRLECRLTRSPSFTALSDFHYRGLPRQVRVWDESLVPGKALTVDEDDIAALFRPLRAPFPALTDTLTKLYDDVRGTPTGSTLVLPDLVAAHGIEADDVTRLFGFGEYQRGVVEALWFLSGRPVTVRRDGRKHTVLDYRDVLPQDLKPLLILDASGRVRPTYQLWKDGKRGDLISLPAAPKSYRNLKARVWSRSGSKTAWRRRKGELLAGIVATVNQKPAEDWLIVHHKAETINGISVPEAVTREFRGDPARLHFVPWGRHTATNDFIKVPNVILAGLLFYPPAHIEATGRAALGLRSEDGPFKPSDRRTVEVGEHKHNVLQAACRGAVRACLGDACKPSSLFVIADGRSGLPAALRKIFPGCEVEAWAPLKAPAKPLRGKKAKAAAYITARLKRAPAALVRFGEVAEAAGISDVRNFKSLRRALDFREALARHGIEEVSAGRKHSGFRRATAQLPRLARSMEA
jgi:hypothetical protein